MHSLIRACNCHVQVSQDLCVADVWATNFGVAANAERILDLPAPELEEAIRLDTWDAIPDGCEEDEDPHCIEVSWVSHPSHPSFSHHTVSPSFVNIPSAQSFSPSLEVWTFKHALDPVQSRGIACVERRESVLLSAPTSAGKTAVAVYAVAMALHEKKRAIYTTPIKALSNQKFLELGKLFGGQYVGIMTGDTVIASDAPIVVMTLEILHSMLYKQARDPNLMDDFAYVIIDEAHFLGNVERGYAWEEVLILLPLHVRLVLLSATVPNSRTIGDWCSRVRTEPMHVITSEQRPVPLFHGVFRCGPPDYFSKKRRSLFSIMNPPRNFFKPWNLSEAVRQRAIILQSQPKWRCPYELLPRFIGRKGQNLKQLMAGLSASVRVADEGIIEVRALDCDVEREAKLRVTRWLTNQGALAKAPDSSSGPLSLQVEDLERLLSLLWYRKQLPTIGFCFDKRMCERIALLLAGGKRMDFSSNAAKSKIHARLQAGLAGLDERDKQLAQVKHCCDLLVRGIGVHHGGMLPLLREIVELLFADGLLPVIFATETFAIGLNMPAKSVIFTDVVKFDGRARRMLNVSEFRQMSGRAGRRGLDRAGYVYIMLHSDQILQQPATTVLTKLYTEEPSEVVNCYRMRWASLLHLISAGPAHVYAMLSRSLQRFTEPTVAMSRQQEARRMVKVLQELDFVDKSGVTLPKGLLACHLFLAEDALLVADILIALRGFENYSAAQSFAICAAFVAEGSYNDRLKISDSAVCEGLAICRKVAAKLAAKLHSHKLPCCTKCKLLNPISADVLGCDGTEMIKTRLNPKLCETALQWASGRDFTSAVLSSGVAVGGEGFVIRALRRLDELMREITFVLRHDLASPETARRIQQARLLVRRGVLAAPSAYLGEAEDRVAEEIEEEPPWPSQTWPPGYQGTVDAFDIGFSQASCSANFHQPPAPGGPNDILGLAKALIDGRVQPAQVNPIKIHWFRHRYYSLDNRRLAAFRLWRLLDKDAKVPVVVLSRNQALRERWLRKFTTGFTGGRKIRITQTDRFVGLTREQSTFGSSLWS
ncbi:ATP-dependent RNA helicase DOB1 (mRNA transport regulator MTR4) [Durusdinium trenchii]